MCKFCEQMGLNGNHQNGGFKKVSFMLIPNDEDIKRAEDFAQMLRNSKQVAIVLENGKVVHEQEIESENVLRLQEAERLENYEKAAEIRDDIIDYAIKKL